MRLWSIGHGSRELEDFILLLKEEGIEVLVDVRSYPFSSRYPHFSRDTLGNALEEQGIAYRHIPELGGMREGGYASYTETEEFKRALCKLVEIATRKRTAFMCAEGDWRKCHRRFIAQELVRKGIEVVHILSKGRREFHPKPLLW